MSVKISAGKPCSHSISHPRKTGQNNTQNSATNKLPCRLQWRLKPQGLFKLESVKRAARRERLKHLRAAECLYPGQRLTGARAAEGKGHLKSAPTAQESSGSPAPMPESLLIEFGSGRIGAFATGLSFDPNSRLERASWVHRIQAWQDL